MARPSCHKAGRIAAGKEPGLKHILRAHPAAWLAFVLVCLFFLFEFVARVEPSLASDGIMKWYGLNAGQFAVLSSLFFWVYAPMQLVVGLMLDRFGARRLVLPALFVCAIGPILFALTPSPAVAGFGRVLTGLGGSFAFVGALYVANHRFPARMFATLSALVGAIGMMGTAVGLVWITRLTEAFGWRQVFLGTGIAGFALFAALALFLKPDNAERMESVAGNPLAALPGLLRNRRLWLIAIVSALYYVPINVYAGLWGKDELQKDFGFTPVAAETAISLLFVGLALGGIVAGWISDRLSHRKWILIGGALVSTALFALALGRAWTSPVPVSALLFAAGAFAAPQILTFAMAKEGHKTAVAGTVMSFVNMIAIGGALLFQPAAGYLLTLTGGDYTLALLPVFAAPVVAAFLSLFISEKRHEDHFPYPRPEA